MFKRTAELPFESERDTRAGARTHSPGGQQGTQRVCKEGAAPNKAGTARLDLKPRAEPGAQPLGSAVTIQGPAHTRELFEQYKTALCHLRVLYKYEIVLFHNTSDGISSLTVNPGAWDSGPCPKPGLQDYVFS